MMHSTVGCLAVLVIVIIGQVAGAAINKYRPFHDEPDYPKDLDGTNTTRDLTALQKWEKSMLTYTITNYPRGMSEGSVKSVIRKAFDSWSRVTNLDFVERPSSVQADIQLSFAGMNHNRRGIPCKYSHENTLAHAFFPQLGDIHFNTKYFFSDDISLEVFHNTAVHEIGHSLGLPHSSSKQSVMFFAQLADNLLFEPQSEDIMAIQNLYGVRSSVPSTPEPSVTSRTTTPPIPRTKTSLCALKSYDTIVLDHRGNICVFAGQFYYNLNETNPPPRKISAKWPGLPQKVDAGITYIDQKTYFYKGDQYWKYDKRRLEDSYPRFISQGFPGTPSRLDALLAVKTGGFLAFQGSSYWLYNTRKSTPVEPDYPKSVADFAGLPSRVDAAVMTTEGRRFLFSGMNYYEMDDWNRIVKREGDVRTDWFKC